MEERVEERGSEQHMVFFVHRFQKQSKARGTMEGNPLPIGGRTVGLLEISTFR
jgi:hypothetical protein